MAYIKHLYFLLLANLFSLQIVTGQTNRISPEGSPKKSAINEVYQKMQQQQACWNNGDIICFMSAYWQSDSLVFIGKSGLTYGWQQTLENYTKSYPSSEEMGQLTFTNKVVRFIDNHAIQVIGKWQLERDEPLKDLEGHYSLIWLVKNGKWVIVSDHSS